MLIQETFLVGQKSLGEDRAQDCLQVLAFDLYFLHSVKKPAEPTPVLESFTDTVNG